MPKVDIGFVAQAMKQLSIEPSKIREVVELLTHEVADDGEEKPAAIKKQYVVLVSDPEGKLPKDDFVAWVVQAPEDGNPRDTLPLIWDAAWAFNISKKGRLLPVKSIGEALESVSAKFFKERNLWIKTKTPILVVKTDNILPKDETINQ